MEIEKIEGFTPSPDDLVKVTYQGNITEIQYLQKRNKKKTIQTIDKDHFIEVSTGELKEYNHLGDDRTVNAQSLKRTFRNLRALINTNCTNPYNIRWCTLTYAENMQESERLMRDYQKFFQRLCRYLSKRGISRPEYIAVAEPQERGAWHLHLLLIWDTCAPFIPNKDFRALWGQGFVKINALDNCDNVGAYLTAYLCDTVSDVPIPDMTGIKNIEVNGKKKSIIKGGRLHFYPKDFSLYRHSRGLKEPEFEMIPYSMAIKKVSAATLTYQRGLKLIDTENEFESICYSEYYNSVRKPLQQ